MTHRHRGARQQHFQGLGTANDIGGADDHRLLALGINAVLFQQRHHAARSARPQQGHLDRQPAHIVGMEAVNILFRIDALDHRLRINLLGQRQLHQNTVDIRVGVQAINDIQQFLLAGAGR